VAQDIPVNKNRVWLDANKKDRYGLLQPHINFAYSNNDEKMLI